HHAAALAAAAKLQYGDAIVDFNQGDIAAVGGEAGVHFAVENIVDLVFHRAVVADLGQTGVGGADGELAAETVVGIVHLGVFEKRQAALFEVGLETVQLQYFVLLLFVTGTAVGDTGFRLGGAGIGDKDADANAFTVLL